MKIISFSTSVLKYDYNWRHFISLQPKIKYFQNKILAEYHSTFYYTIVQIVLRPTNIWNALR